MPKSVHIIDQMPLTAVGKIFKPDLRRREIADAMRSVLAAAGVDPFDFEVEDDKARGIMLRLAVADSDQEALARSALGKFPFAVTIAGPHPGK